MWQEAITMFVLSDLVVLLVPTIGRYGSSFDDALICHFAVIDYSLHVSPTNFNNYLPYAILDTLPHVALVVATRYQFLQLMIHYWWISIFHVSTVLGDTYYGTSDKTMLVIRRICSLKLCTHSVVQLSSCAALLQWNIGDQIRRRSVVFGVRPLVSIFGSILTTTSPWIRSSVL